MEIYIIEYGNFYESNQIFNPCFEDRTEAEQAVKYLREQKFSDVINIRSIFLLRNQTRIKPKVNKSRKKEKIKC